MFLQLNLFSWLLLLSMLLPLQCMCIEMKYWQNLVVIYEIANVSVLVLELFIGSSLTGI